MMAGAYLMQIAEALVNTPSSSPSSWQGSEDTPELRRQVFGLFLYEVAQVVQKVEWAESTGTPEDAESSISSFLWHVEHGHKSKLIATIKNRTVPK